MSAVGLRFGRPGQVQRTSALAPRAEIHALSCYVAKVPRANFRRCAACHGFTTLRLRPFDPSRFTALDYISNQKPRIDGSGIHDRVRVRTFRKGLTYRVNGLDAILVVEVDAPLFDGDQEEPGVAMPASIAARPHNKILKIHFC